MVSIDTARQIILENVAPLATESVPVLEGLNRICAEDCYSQWDIPPVDNSEMDGYAFSFESLSSDALKVTGFVPAGVMRTVPVPPGEAVKIMTGACLPPCVDTVVPIEEVEVEGDCIRLTGRIQSGNHVRKRGDDIPSHDLVIPCGTLLRPQETGMLTAMGRTEVTVFRRARVAVLATGDELENPGSIPRDGRIINSNSNSIAAQVMDAGGIPHLLGIARDSREATITKIREGIAADFLIVTGGVSVGDRDYVRESICSLGGELKFWKVEMKPGKPLAFALLQGKPVFALPGNPVSAMVSFEQFVRPALLKAMGHKRIYRPIISAILNERLENSCERPNLIRGNVIVKNGSYFVTSSGKQGSNRLSSLVRGNGLIFLPPFVSLPAGTHIEVELIDREFELRETTRLHY
jgi:molybdopterin molybdotransferase